MERRRGSVVNASGRPSLLRVGELAGMTSGFSQSGFTMAESIVSGIPQAHKDLVFQNGQSTVKSARAPIAGEEMW